jgi:hypothetical protein
MTKRVLLLILGLLVFASVSYFRYDSIHESALRLAEANRDMCYGARGYHDAFSAAPPEVVSECTQSMADYSAGENARYLRAGLEGLAAALVVGGLGWLLMRRRQAAPAPPEA